MSELGPPVRSSVTIAVLTYRRNEPLAALLPALGQELADAAPDGLVLVVDNDPAAGAEAVVHAIGLPGQQRQPQYVAEPVPGIAAARNRAMDEATTPLLVFIDDDEQPVAGWLGHLLQTFHRESAAAVVGPVVSHFAAPVPAFVSAGGFFHRRRLPTGSQLTVAATNNLLLDLRAVHAAGLRFDERFGLTGGSDYHFTSQLHRSGHRLVWCDEAVVLDVVPPQRATKRWVLQRAFRSGNSTAVIEVLLTGGGRPGAVMRARQARDGATRVCGGVAELAAGVLRGSLPLRARGARHLARGAGLLAGAAGYVYGEYRRPASRARPAG